MNETCQNAEKFLSELVRSLRFDLSVSSEWTDEGCVLNLQGDDAHFLLTENGEMLDALETLLFQIYGRELDREHRLSAMPTAFAKLAKPSSRQWRALPPTTFAKRAGRLPSACSIRPSAA